jgi:SAM-dependent methyltransferase
MKSGRRHREAGSRQTRSKPVDSSAAGELEPRDTTNAGLHADDEAFDEFMPHEDQRASANYWTPLHVAAHAARWLDHFGARSVVDIGSGVGKFCVGAALASQCHFTGIEHRMRLVEVARSLARTFEVEDRIDFVESSLSDGAWPEADAYYLYNPFAENLYRRENQLDGDVELGLDRFKREIATAERFIERAPRGTYLLTYNGFGGRVPDSYQQVAVDRELPFELRMWRKERHCSDGKVWRSG